jgi:hypothetical protein
MRSNSAAPTSRQLPPCSSKEGPDGKFDHILSGRTPFAQSSLSNDFFEIQVLFYIFHRAV